MTRVRGRVALRQRVAAAGVAFGLLLSAASVAPPATPAQAQQIGLEQLRFCRDANGERLRGDIDILLLLDDTLTLVTQDRGNLRFGIIRNFLEGVTQIESAQRVNFAAYTFGEIVTPILDFDAITASDIDRIDRIIRDNNPAQQNKTDFIRAMARATQSLNARPAQNCRILLWFTDGNHDGSNLYGSQVDRDESRELRRTFCEPDGIADRVRSQRINTFVLLLEPPALQPLRLEASKDVFQILTGDPFPNFPDENRPGRTPTDECDRPLGEQLGKVFAVTQAGELLAIIADFVNELEDGGRITEESCPYPDGALDSLALPDAYLVDWLSATDFSSESQSRAPIESRLRVISAEGEEFSGEDVFLRYRQSGPSVRFRITAEYRDVLGAGWVVRADEGLDLCLRAKSVDLLFRLSSGDPDLSVVRPSGLPSRLWAEGQLGLFSPDGRPISTTEALRSPEVRGRLRVESAEALSRDGTLPAQIVIDGAPQRADACSVIEIPAALSIARGGIFRPVLEAPETPLISSECMITPATRGEDGGMLDFGRTLAGLADLRGSQSCDIGDDWHVLIDGQRIAATTYQLIPGGTSISFALASGVEPPNESRDCIAYDLPPVEFFWQGQSIAIPATITAEWNRRGDVTVASGFTVFAMLLALLLSYGLLLALNWLLLRAPLGKKVRSFDVDAELVLTRSGNPQLEGLKITPGGKKARIGRGGGWKPLTFKDANFEFRRHLTWNPLKEPTLRMYVAGSVNDARITAVSKPGVGLAIPIDFSDLAVLWAPSEQPATPERGVAVKFTVAYRVRDKVDLEAVFERLKESAPDLAMRLQQALQPTAPKNQAQKPSSDPRGASSGPGGEVKRRRLSDAEQQKTLNRRIGTEKTGGSSRLGKKSAEGLDSRSQRENSGESKRPEGRQRKRRPLGD
jgi:hypothetical protein